MYTFLKEAKGKQKWTTFARIHRLACQRNTSPCAPSILKHRVSAEVCLLTHQWISRGFTLIEVQYHQYKRSQKVHWTLFNPRNVERLANRCFPEKRSLDVSLGPYQEMSVSNPPPPQKKSISSWIRYAYSKYAFDFPRSQIHDLVQQDGPILEPYRVQLRHAKL